MHIFATKIIICNLSLVMILLSLFQFTFSFAFKQVLTQATVKTINTLSTYTFTYDRANNNFGGFTAWNTELVNATDTIRIIFPSDYPFTGTQDCTGFAQVTVNAQSIDTFTCTRNVRTYTIANAFQGLTNLAISDVVLVLTSVLNPSPAVQTGQFIGYIGNDVAAGKGGSIQLQPGRFTSAKIRFNPTTVNTVGAMIFQITPKNQIPLTGSIVIALPSTRVWTYDINAAQLPLSTTMSCSKYSANVQTTVNCTGDFTSFSIIATDLFSAPISILFSFGVNNFISPPTTQEIDKITITSYYGNYKTDSTTSKIDTIQASISDLTAKSLQRLDIYPISTGGDNISMIVNSQVGLMFNMTLSDVINQNDAFQIIFPSSLTFNITSNVGGTGRFNTPTRNGQTLTITQRTNAINYSASSVFVISFFNFTAPPSTKVSDPITVKIKRGSYQKMIGSATVKATFAPLNAILSTVLKTVSAVTSYNFNVTISHPLLSSGMVKIYFPNQIDVTAVPINCATLLGTSVSFTPTCSLIAAQRSVTLSQLNSSTSNIPSGQVLQFTVTNIKNAPTTATTGGFTVQTYYSSDTTMLVARGQIQGLNMTAGTIISSRVSVVPSSYICLQGLVNYTIRFQSNYALPTNGYVQLLVPRRITMNIGSVGNKCEYSLNDGTFTSTTCVGDNSSATHYKVTFSGVAQTQIAANSNISLRIINIFTNPDSTAIVSSFGISTFAQDGSAISFLLTGITVQMTTPASFINFDVKRLQHINSAPAEYEVTLSQKTQLQINAIYQVQFPSEVQLGASPVCTPLFTSSINCTASSNTLTVTLLSVVTSLTQFGVKVAGVLNPPSFKPLVNPFVAISKTSDGISKYSQQSKVFSLSNLLQSSFKNIESTFTPRTYGSSVFLTIKLTPSVKIIPTKIVVSFPPATFTINGALGCSSLSISGQCDDNQTSTHSIQITGTLTASQMIFTITGLISPNSASSQFVTVTSFDSLGFKIDKSDNFIKFQVLCTLPCRTCTGVTTQCLSCYSNPISDRIYLYQTNMECLNSCPVGTYQDKTVFKCLTCDSICQQCKNLAQNCTKCYQNTAFKYLNISGGQQTCLSGCTTGYYPDTSRTPTTCVLCQDPCVTCTARTVCLSCNSSTFFNGSQCVQKCISNTQIQNVIARRCDLCDQVCATCSILVDNCTSCGQKSAFHNNRCVSVCPNGLVVNNRICASCDPICLTCSISYQNCTSCNISSANNKYLLNNTCIAVCSQLYYADTLTASCKLCSTLSLNCNNCSSRTTCLSCNDPYVLLGTTCLSSTPVGYVNITNVAMPCTGDCQTCQVSQSTCTSCKTLNYYQNKCQMICPNITAPQFKRCQPCDFPCQTCLNQRNNCTSCLSNQSPQYYLNSNDCEHTCPDYTYGDNLTNKCEPCVYPCSTCNSSQDCLSCVILSGKVLQGIRCVSICNTGYVAINGFCTPCLANCSQCTGTASKCTKCIANHFLVTSTSTCVDNCPFGLYKDIESGKCTGCAGNCSTCVNTSTTCTTCLSGIFFNNTCVKVCPEKYYELNDICQPCPSECRTCQSASHCNSCIFTYYLYLGIFCVNPCPNTYPVIADNGSCIQCTDTQCTTCNASDYCSSCSFPYLLHFGKCVDKCPTNYTANSTDCKYDPIANETNQTSTINQTLEQTLTTPNMFPVPFTISAAFLGVACLMSKFQYAPTFISGSLYAIFSLIQWASLIFAFTLTFLRYASITFKRQYVQEIYPFYILLICLGIHYVLNLFALIVQNSILRYNNNFQRWSSIGITKAFYVICSIISLLASHKFKNVMFCKLFNFNIFKAQLDSVQEFKVFNAFSFLGFAPAAGNIVAIVILMMWNPEVNTQLFMAYIDALAMVVLCIILAIFNTCKDDQFFEQTTVDGHIFHRRIQQSDQIMKEAIMPPTIFDEQFQGYGRLQSGTDLKMRLTKYPYSQTDSEVNSQDFVKNVSIQVNQIIEKQFDQSKISHLQGQSSIPEMSLFSKHEKSIQYSKKSQHQVSIQQNPISQHDISLQNAPNYNDEGIQYSAKPIFQNVSQDFISDISHSDEQQESNINNQATRPVKKERGLRAQLQLDIDQKLKRRQQQLKNLQQQNRRIERQGRTKNFQKKASSKLTQRQAQRQQTPVQNGINRQKVNNYFNNDQSIGQQSSQLDSQGDIMANLRNGSKHNRLNSQKSEQQILALLEKGKKSRQKDMYVDLGNRNEESNKSLSFNVTRDLDPANHSRDSHLQEGQVLYSNKPNEKINNNISEQRSKQREAISQDSKKRQGRVIYQQEDKSRKSDDDVDDGQQGINQVNVIRGDNNEYLPENFDKSRSTNNISISKQMARRNRNNPLLQNSAMIEDSRNDQYQEIIYNPIDPRYHRGVLPQSRYQGDQLDFDTRTNVTKFLGRKSNNQPSAQQNQNMYENDFNLQSRQMPLQNKSKERSVNNVRANEDLSNFNVNPRSAHVRSYRMDSKQIIKGSKNLKNLSFNDDDKIEVTQENYGPKQQQVPHSQQMSIRQMYQNDAISREMARGALNQEVPIPRLRTAKSQKKFKSNQKPMHRQLLNSKSKKDFQQISRVTKYLEKQQKKAENSKKRLQQIQYMLEREPPVKRQNSQNKTYMKDTYTSQQKRKSLQKVYLNRLKKN